MGQSWENIKKGFITTINGIIGGLNAGMAAIASGINFVVNGIISAINAVINAYNSLPEKLRIFGSAHTISTVNIAAPSIPLITAATGFQGKLSQDTIFQPTRARMLA